MYQFPEDLRKAYESSPLSFVYYQNIDGRSVPLLVSDGFCRHAGVSRESALEWLENGLFELVHPDDTELVAVFSRDFRDQRLPYDVVLRSKLGPGSTDYDPDRKNAYVRIHAVGRWQTMPDGTELMVVSYANLSLTQKAIGTELDVYKALQRDHFYTDPLTGLPNYNYLYDHGDEKVLALREANRTPCVIYTNVYGMRSYNAQYVVDAGDRLLCLVAKTLTELFPRALVGRSSDDHFITIACMDDTEALKSRLTEANRIIRGAAEGNTSGIRSGVCAVAADSTPGSTLDQARQALKLIENNMNRVVAFFSDEANGKYLQERYILENLDRAVENGWIKVYYHALYRIQTGKIAAFEALARWEDPVRGVLPPSDFIPVLQKYHLLYKVDLSIFEQVCREVRIRRDNGLPLVPVSVNFSMQDFDYADVVQKMNELYDAYHLSELVDKSYFIVEITEQELAEGTDELKRQLKLIRENGYRLWLDDFGSGYSAISMFSQYEFDLVKFDMDLLRHLDDADGVNRIVLRDLVQMVRQIGMHTLIEGVETEEQLDFVREIGCELAQGYYFYKPESLDHILMRIKGGDVVKKCETPEERTAFLRMWFNDWKKK